MTTPLTVRPVVHTTRTPEWLALAHGLGAIEVVRHDGWSVVALGSGRLGIHAADEEDDGTWTLGFETPDLDAFVAEVADDVRAAGGSIEPFVAGHGPSLHITGPDGLTFLVDSPEHPEIHARDSSLAVAPLWMTAQVEDAARLLEALGLDRRTTSDSGAWVDLRAASGLQAVHADGDPGTSRGSATESRVVPGFEHPDVGELASHLESAGITSRLIDESYSRTLRLDDPDGGTEIWVNETMRDLYGYTSSDGAAAR